MYKATKLSLLRFLKNETTGLGLGGSISVLDLDGTSAIQELPEGDIVGIGGVVVSDEGEMWDVTFSVTCITYSDPNVMRLTDLVNHFQRRLKPKEQVDIYDPDSLLVIAKLQTIPGTQTSSVGRAEVRAAVSVVVNAKIIPVMVP